MTEKVTGIVISEADYGETSKILNLLTVEKGLVGVISKGCRSVKSPLCSVSQKLTYGCFHVYYKEGKLSILKSVDVINTFSLIRKDIVKISYAALILDLAEQVYKECQLSEVVDVALSGLLKINEDFDPLVISLIIELRYLDYLGVAPVLNECTVCGTVENIKTLSIKKGGYVCSACYDSEKVYSQKTIKMIRMFYYVDLEKISRISIQDDVKKEIRHFLNYYYDDYTGIYLKSKDFLTKLEKM